MPAWIFRLKAWKKIIIWKLLEIELKGWKKVLFWDFIASAGAFWVLLSRKEFRVPEVLFVWTWAMALSSGLLILLPLAKEGSPKSWRGFDPFALVALVNLSLALGFRASVFLWNSLAKEIFLFPEAYLGAGLWMFLALANGVWASYLRRNS